jgi:signal transduction histidine kinase
MESEKVDSRIGDAMKLASGPGAVVIVPDRVRMLHEFLFSNRSAILERTRAKVAARLAPRATEEELQRGIPLFFDQLIDSLRGSRTSSLAMGEGASRHGADLLKRGFTVAQVVHDYGGVCQAVTELADETNAPISADEFHTFNRCLDDAIAGAVTEYMRQHEISITDQGTERLGDLAHELRNALGVAMLAYQTLRPGSVGLGGSTSTLLGRSLMRLSRLIDSSLAQVRLESGVRATERVAMRAFMEEVEVGATMEANVRDLTLEVTVAEPDVEVLVDRQLLAEAVNNLLQNAFKFTRPHSRVSLKASSTRDRVLIEVEDECGGLPPHKGDELFRPFQQRGADRTGLGLGLSISRRSVEADGGEIRVRDIPGTGCVFAIDLPRLSPAVVVR